MASNNKNKNQHVKTKYKKTGAETPKSVRNENAKSPADVPAKIDPRIIENVRSNLAPIDYKTDKIEDGAQITRREEVRLNRDNTPMTSFGNLINTAPYNFVSLSKQLVLPPVGNYIAERAGKTEKIAAYKEYLLGQGKYAKHTGYFDIIIKNITPLYISDGKSFFNDGQNICIPGSSVRGALKNIFGIITNSGFKPDEDFTDSHIYYRAIAGENHLNELKKYYSDKMTEPVPGEKSRNLKVKSGYLVRQDGVYYIVPTKDQNLNKVEGINVERKYPDKHIITKIYVGIQPDLASKALKAGMLWHDEYVDVFSGEMQTKKRFYRFGSPDLSASPLEIPASLLNYYWDDTSKGRLTLCSRDGKAEIENLKLGFAQNGGSENFVDQNLGSYYTAFMSKKNYPPVVWKFLGAKGPFKNDKEGKYKVPWNDPEVLAAKEKVLDRFAVDREPLTGPSSLLYGMEGYDYIIPCFYQSSGNQVISFGANPYYRIAYDNSVAGAVPDVLKSGLTDFSDAIFGSAELWGSRVFFEDCKLENSTAQMDERHEAIPLRTPNPSSFQNYLEQYGNIANWDVGDADIRGNKLYWHRNMDWKTKTDLDEKNKTYLEPLKPNHTFKGRIRFENLDDIELGALARVFELASQPNIALKLGMGKSIGLGSVKISASLYEEDKNYLFSLFGNNGAFTDYQPVKYNPYVDLFKKYMSSALNDQTAIKVYENRIQELKLILSTDFMDNKEFKKKTDYLPFEEKDPETGETIKDKKTGKAKPNKVTQEIYSKKVPLPDISTIVKSLKNT